MWYLLDLWIAESELNVFSLKTYERHLVFETSLPSLFSLFCPWVGAEQWIPNVDGVDF